MPSQQKNGVIKHSVNSSRSSAGGELATRLAKPTSYARTALVVVFAMLLPVPTSATDYEVSTSRVGRDLYVINGKDVILQTRGCVEYSQGDPGRLMVDGSAGTLRFLKSGQECTVTEVFGPVTQTVGDYPVHAHVLSRTWIRLEEHGIHLLLAKPGYRDRKKEMRATLHIGKDGRHYLKVRKDKLEIKGIYRSMDL